MVDTHFQAETPMAKQKTKRAPLRVPRATGSSPQAQWIDGHLRPTAFRAATLIHPVNFNPSLSRRVKNSQWKHRNDNHLIPTSHPTLAERFHALPGELREHVFAILLVRSPRFDLDHSAGCPASTLPAAVEIRPTFSSQSHSCGLFPNAFSFLRNKPFWHDPWRSHYAPPVQHPFKCSNCCDRKTERSPSLGAGGEKTCLACASGGRISMSCSCAKHGMRKLEGCFTQGTCSALLTLTHSTPS